MQGDTKPVHETQQPPQGHGEPPSGPLGQSVVEEKPRKNKKRGYFRKPQNWVSLLTMVFVAAYTILTVFILCTQRDSEQRQLRAYVGAYTAPGDIILAQNQKVVVQALIKNVGSTPAFKVKQNGAAVMLPFPLPAPIQMGARLSGTQFSEITLWGLSP